MFNSKDFKEKEQIKQVKSEKENYNDKHKLKK